MTGENIFTYYLRGLFSRWRLMFGVIAASTLVAFLFSALVLANSPTFTAAARLNVVPTAQELGYADRYSRGQATQGGLILMQTYAEYARAKETRQQVVNAWIAAKAERAGMGEEEWLKANFGPPSMLSPGNLWSLLNYGKVPQLPPREALVADLEKSTTVEGLEGTYIMQVEVAWDDPQDAAWLANELSSAVVANSRKLSRESGENLSNILSGELEEKKQELAEKKRLSRERKITLGVVDIDRQKQALLDAQLAEQDKLTGAIATAREARAQVSSLRSQQSEKLSETQNTIDQQLALEAPKADAAEQSVRTRQARLRRIDSELGTLAKAELAIKDLDDEIKALESEVADLTQRTQFSNAENLANMPLIRLIETATPPAVRSSPKVALNTLLGFIGGCAIAGMLLLLLGPAPTRAQVSDREEEDDEDEVPTRKAASEPEPEKAERNPASPKMGEPVAAASPSNDDFAEPRPDQGRPAVMPVDRHVDGGSSTPLRTSVPTRPLVTTSPAATAAALAYAEEDEDEPAPQPQASAEPVPTPAPKPVASDLGTSSPENAGIMFRYRVPLPRNGGSYEESELRRLGPRLSEYLVPVVDAGRPLTIGGAGAGDDAMRMVRLLYKALPLCGVETQIVPVDANGNIEGSARNASGGLVLVPVQRDLAEASKPLLADADCDHLLVGRASASQAIFSQAAQVRKLKGREPLVVFFDS